jgi:circadian clock protein KaiB
MSTKRPIAPARFKFRLYVAGDAPNSAQALANLASLCHTHLPGRHEIDVVDVFQEPGRALADGIFLTPTLVKLAPPPTQSIVGTLSQTQTVLLALGLATDNAA